jgi:hypothetical protein
VTSLAVSVSNGCLTHGIMLTNRRPLENNDPAFFIAADVQRGAKMEFSARTGAFRVAATPKTMGRFGTCPTVLAATRNALGYGRDLSSHSKQIGRMSIVVAGKRGVFLVPWLYACDSFPRHNRVRRQKDWHISCKLHFPAKLAQCLYEIIMNYLSLSIGAG